MQAISIMQDLRSCMHAELAITHVVASRAIGDHAKSSSMHFIIAWAIAIYYYAYSISPDPSSIEHIIRLATIYMELGCMATILHMIAIILHD